SMASGIIGMYISVRSNVRTAAAARHSLVGAGQTALRGGAVAGFLVVALSLLGVYAMFALYGGFSHPNQAPFLIVGYGFGASFVALFAQLGGGIYTKAADVGSDLVGKVEAGIPEDDPRNAGVVADLVGDNVGADRPVRETADASKTGPATNVISGTAVGFETTALTAITIGIALFLSHWLGQQALTGLPAGQANPGGIFGTAVATMGMLMTTAFILAMDTFGPITDNAGGIAEFSHAEAGAREITDRLDAVGNTTKALTKGYAIASASLAAFLLFSAYIDKVNLILSRQIAAGTRTV